MPYCVGQLMDYFGKAKENPDEVRIKRPRLNGDFTLTLKICLSQKTFLGLGLGQTVAVLSAIMLTGSACALARSVLMEMSA